MFGHWQGLVTGEVLIFTGAHQSACWWNLRKHILGCFTHSLIYYEQTLRSFIFSLIYIDKSASRALLPPTSGLSSWCSKYYRLVILQTRHKDTFFCIGIFGLIQFYFSRRNFVDASGQFLVGCKMRHINGFCLLTKGYELDEGIVKTTPCMEVFDPEQAEQELEEL